MSRLAKREDSLLSLANHRLCKHSHNQLVRVYHCLFTTFQIIFKLIHCKSLLSLCFTTILKMQVLFTLHETSPFPLLLKTILMHPIKICHSSTFQTISRRSVYIKMFNYSDSISANLNNTMQTKQHAMKKTHSYSNRNKIYKGLFFVVEGF